MSSIDGVLLTLVNTVVCLTLPKLLSVVLATKNQKPSTSKSATELQDTASSIPSYVDIAS
ncbi:hypothetical protein [Nostoc sp. CMAA1605]|uniref:hypothetical protein n=1 Tax=Nostoc sp. CMAA1605 TaxID=2055159 RepID=UPI001F39805D|nr:hypothetical protein [Nostoc sp. CMAA1605]MCF4966465.1 hypothetical protein [Nostoc sp. CMAA1605]